jgi:hypothetical protein
MQNQVQLTCDNKKNRTDGVFVYGSIGCPQLTKKKNHRSTKGAGTPLRNSHTMGIGKGIIGYFPESLFTRCLFIYSLSLLILIKKHKVKCINSIYHNTQGWVIIVKMSHKGKIFSIVICIIRWLFESVMIAAKLFD